MINGSVGLKMTSQICQVVCSDHCMAMVMHALIGCFGYQCILIGCLGYHWNPYWPVGLNLSMFGAEADGSLDTSDKKTNFPLLVLCIVLGFYLQCLLCGMKNRGLFFGISYSFMFSCRFWLGFCMPDNSLCHCGCIGLCQCACRKFAAHCVEFQ